MTQPRARPPHRLHPAGPLPGAEPRLQDRLPAAPAAPLARAAQPAHASATAAPTSCALLAPRADPRARVGARALSASVLRRPAPAPDDCRRARLQPRACHCRRADHRARRHHPAADPQAAEIPDRGIRHRHAVRDARLRRGRPAVRRRHRHVCRARPWRPGRRREVLADPRHPYTRALLACHPDRSDGARRHPRPGAVAAQAPAGLPLHPALPARRRGLQPAHRASRRRRARPPRQLPPCRRAAEAPA